MRGNVYQPGFSRIREREYQEKIASLTALADVNNLITDASGYFYDVFVNDASNNSCATIATVSSTLTEAISAGSSGVQLDSSTGLKAGREYTLIDENSGNAENVIIDDITINRVVSGQSEIATDGFSETVCLDNQTVTAGDFSTEGVGGRKLVMLINGWLAVGVLDTTTTPYTTRIYLSRDKGITWTQLCYYQQGSTDAGFVAMAASLYDVKIYMVSPGTTNTALRFFSIDAISQTNVNIDGTGVLVDTQTAYQSASITTDVLGYIHIAYSSKNATYPNKYNIKYAKSVDGGATWPTINQVTIGNVYNSIDPFMLINVIGQPIIFFKFDSYEYIVAASPSFSSYNALSAPYSNWGNSIVCSYNNNIYQWAPCVTIDYLGRIHAVWYGIDTTDNTSTNIRYSMSVDHGVTWSDPIKLTSGNTHNQKNASIWADYKGNVYVYWQGTTANGYFQIRRRILSLGTWSDIEDITPVRTTHAQHPSICIENNMSLDPLWVYKDSESTSIKLGGKYVTKRDLVCYKPEGGRINSKIPRSTLQSIGGRRLVRLSNGWLVAALSKTTSPYGTFIYVSKNEGVSWELFGNTSTPGAYNNANIASYGNIVCLVESPGTTISTTTIDFTTATSMPSGVNADSGQNSTGECSVAFDSSGTIHIVWVSKNSTYSNSWNLRYTKSTTLGASFDAAIQFTTSNTTDTDQYSPTIIIRTDNRPLILWIYQSAGTYRLMGSYHNGTSWLTGYAVTTPLNYVQSSISATVTSTGQVHIVWHGSDSTDKSIYNIRYCKSTDNGATWGTVTKLTSGNTYPQTNPSITRDKNDNLYVRWQGTNSAFPSNPVTFGMDYVNGSWTPYRYVERNTTGIRYPSLCDNYRDFVEPLMLSEITGSAITFTGIYESPIVVSNKGTVVAAAYSSAGTGGRKLVKLANGWLVAAVLKTTSTYGSYVYVNKMDGVGWIAYGNISSAAARSGLAIASHGNRVYLVEARATTLVFASFDPTVDTMPAGVDIDTSQTAMGGCSITVYNGDIYIAWSSKNATYANSYNLRYIKSTTGGASWSGITQVSTLNTSGHDLTAPCIVVNNTGKPQIICAYVNASSNTIQNYYWTGAAWTNCYVNNIDLTYAKISPCATVDVNGHIHVVWQSTGADSTSYHRIRYSKSTDGGSTWAALMTISAAYADNQQDPTITSDYKGELYVYWRGRHTGSATYEQIRYTRTNSGLWGPTFNLTAATNNQYYPNTYESKDFLDPLVIWQNNQTSSVDFRGSWRETSLKIKTGLTSVKDYTSSPISLIASAYSTASTGNKLVRLDNGWLVALTTRSTFVDFHISKDNGASWTLTRTTNGWDTTTPSSIATWNNVVYILNIQSSTGKVWVTCWDPIVDNPYSSVFIGTAQTSLGEGSLAITSTGILWAVWTSKNATYPNSFNIQHSYSLDGGKTWDTPAQLTTENTAGMDFKNPYILIGKDNLPYIFAEKSKSGDYDVRCYRRTGSTFTLSTIHGGASLAYAQSYISGAVDSKGVMHVIWHGKDSTDTTYNNICYSKSTDRGVTWSARAKVTTGNAYNQENPRISIDADDNLHVYWEGTHVSSTTYKQIRYTKCNAAGSWGSIINTTSGTNHQTSPQALQYYNKSISQPPVIWMDSQNSRVAFSGNWNIEQNSVITGTAWDISGNGGRKLTKLSNGWLVASAYKASATQGIYFYVSKNNGKTWSQLTYWVIGGTTNYHAIASYGTVVHAIRTRSDGTVAYSIKFDAATVLNTDRASTELVLDSSQTAFGACSICIDTNGVLYAAWCSKNATYSSDFNLRYTKSINGGTSWAAVTQVTTNSGGNPQTNPCILVNSQGHPYIFSKRATGSSTNAIRVIYYNGSSWLQGDVSGAYVANTYDQDKPCACITDNGHMHCVWVGSESGLATTFNIWYSKSIDGGATWSTAVRVTNETTHAYNQYSPTIQSDKYGAMHVYFTGYTAAISGAVQLKYATNAGGTWVVKNLTALTSSIAANNVQVCSNYTDSYEPLFIYDNVSTGNIEFSGSLITSGSIVEYSYDEFPAIIFVEPTTYSYDVGAKLKRTTATVDRITNNDLKFTAYAFGQRLIEEVRMEFDPANFASIYSYIKYTQLAGFEIKAYLAVFNENENEIFEEMSSSVETVDVGIDQLESLKLVQPKTNATLKLVLERDNTGIVPSVKSILGAVA